MAEYVCELTPDDPNVPYDSDDYSGECVRRERVVRCRDCGWSCDCEGEMRCEHFHFYEVEPDGFCAWASPRKED